MNKLKRYVIFLIGLFVNSLGVSLITKASLGTSPISSIPYVLSLSFPFTLGNFTIFFSVFLILLQLLILRKNFKLEHVLQIPVSIVFGYFIGEPLAPGANPSYGAEQNGLLASLNSVAKLDYEDALDGISNTQTINPDALGHTEEERTENLVHVLDGYFDQGAHHLNVNVFGLDKLKDAMEHPEKPEYANFTIRVSGYAVKFIDLTREQQLDVIARTCHEAM